MDDEQLPPGVPDPILREMAESPELITAMNAVGDHLTVRETIFHVRQGRNPVSIDSAFCKKVETQEQPYQREYTVGEEWSPLAKGSWIDQASMILVENREGTFFATQPTDEEKQLAASKIVEVRYSGGTCNDDVWEIGPTESMRGCPKSLQSLQIRCRSGEARVTVTVLPR